MLHELDRLKLEPHEINEEVERAVPQLFEAYPESLVIAAINAGKRAEHWNKEHPTEVGCSILALGEDMDFSKPELFTGANIKKQEGMLAWPRRKCAEMTALASALNHQDENSEEVKLANQGWTDKEMEVGSLREGGVIVGIVTASEQRNTGEADTFNHDVLYSCKQCMTDYDILYQAGRISKKTVIYNIRTKNGKPVAGEPVSYEKLLEKFGTEKEQRNLKSIEEMLEAKQKAVNGYLEKVKNINENFIRQKNALIRHSPEGPGELEEELRFLQRDAVEDKWAAFAECFDTISHALKSAAEEGVPKQRLVDSLGLPELKMSPETRGFSQNELDKILDELKKPLVENLQEHVQ